VAQRSRGLKVRWPKVVELRSRKYLSRYDLRLLFNGFAHCLVIGVRQASIVLSRALVYNVMVENLCSSRDGNLPDYIRGFDSIHSLKSFNMNKLCLEISFILVSQNRNSEQVQDCFLL
jgi:hypothetical protein